MFSGFESMQKFGKEQMEATTTIASELTKSLQTIAAEASDYSKRSLQENTAFVEKLMGVRKIEDAVQLQTEFAKSSFEGFVSQMTKMGELYTNFAKEAFKPVEGMMSKVTPR